MEGVIKRKGWLKSNKVFNKMAGSSPQKQRLILDTSNGKLNKPIASDGQRSITLEEKEIRTMPSTDTGVGAGKTQWVNTRQWKNSDGTMNATI